ISPGSTPARSTAARTAKEARVGDLMVLKAPLNALAIGVRAVARITASVMTNAPGEMSKTVDGRLPGVHQALQQRRRLEPHLPVVTQRLAVVLDACQYPIQAELLGVMHRATQPGRKTIASDPHQ